VIFLLRKSYQSDIFTCSIVYLKLAFAILFCVFKQNGTFLQSTWPPDNILGGDSIVKHLRIKEK